MLILGLVAVVAALAGALITFLALGWLRARKARTDSAPGESSPAAPSRKSLGLQLGLALIGLAVMASVAAYVTIAQPEGGWRAKSQNATAAHPMGDVEGMVAQLEDQVEANPNEPEGWRMLGWSYMRLGRNEEAAQAYERASALAPQVAGYQSARGEALTQAADGVVTPEAEAAFNAALALDPADPAARYYLAYARDQKGDSRGAMEDWIALLNDSPPDAPWTNDVRSAVEQIAAEKGYDITGRLPPAPPGPPAGSALSGLPRKGPNAAQVAEAARLPEQDQQAMISGMVDGLAERLRAQPRDADGWARLMRSRMVLNQPAAAADAYGQAMRVFADSPRDQASLRATAQELGIPAS